jgi:hypothetical protein
MRCRACCQMTESTNFALPKRFAKRRLGSAEDTKMAALIYEAGNSPAEQTPPRGVLLRMLDTLAEWQMRHAHSVINRGRKSTSDNNDDVHNQAA